MPEFETRCQFCGRPYEYAKTYGCKPDWCAKAPADLINAQWEEFKKEFHQAQYEIQELRKRVHRLEWEVF